MRPFTSKNGVLPSDFDSINEGEAAADINSNSIKHPLIKTHKIAANRGKIKAHLPLEHIFRILQKLQKGNQKHWVSYTIQNS